MKISKLKYFFIKERLLLIYYFFKISGVYKDKKLKQAVINFCVINRNYWQNTGKLKRNLSQRKVILVEGFLAQYGPNYAFRTGLVAMAISDKYGSDVEVILRGSERKWEIAKQLYQSFGFNNFIFTSKLPLFINTLFAVKAIYSGLYAARKLNIPGDISKIKFDGILVGDLIYDDYIKFGFGKTISKINSKLILLIIRSKFLYLQYKYIFEKNDFKFYIASHVQYSTYGLACRVALRFGAKVIETTDIQMSIYENLSEDMLPTYHQGMQDSIEKNYPSSGNILESMREIAKTKLAKRMSCEVNQIDVKNAYSGNIYSKSELIEYYGLDISNYKKVIFIVAHVFSDAPHSASKMLYDDYYQWLLSTLNIIKKNPNVLWVVKPHPASKVYNEEGIVSDMISTLGVMNIRTSPPNLNVKSLINIADAIVTVLGTAGLEFSCFGIPSVLAGLPFYGGKGFTIDCETIEAYENTLLNIENVMPLTENQVQKALEIYSLWDAQFDWENPIITSEVLKYVWGSGVDANLNNAYDLINANLLNNNPMDLRLWKFCQANL